MGINTSSHQFFTDNTGKKQSVLLSYEEYERMLSLVEKYTEYVNFESSMVENFKEIRDIKRGKKKAKSLLSLLDEL